MRRYTMFTCCIAVGIVSLLVLPCTLFAQYTDLRKRSYTTSDVEKALFPDAQPPGRLRGLQPQRQPTAPPGPTAVTPPAEKVSVALNVFFEFNSDKILPKHYADLNKLGSVLKKYPNRHFQIEGYTDDVGSEGYNQTLSEQRAESVKRYLVQHFSIPEDSLTVKGFGKGNPREKNDTSQGRSANRRVELVNPGQ